MRRLLCCFTVVGLLGLAPSVASAQDVVDDLAPIVLPGEEQAPPVSDVPDVPDVPDDPAPVVDDPSASEDDGSDVFAPGVADPIAPVLRPGIRLRSDGTVAVDSRVPKTVRKVIRAANAIAKTPYKWGGGHGKLVDTGYDCSGSVSYALRGGGLLAGSLVSGALAKYGRAGKGRWITIYANSTHVYMVVGGLRYDTSGRTGRQTRWQLATRPSTRFAIRHPAGL